MLIDWFTVLAQIVNFLILVALMKRFLWGRLVAAIDERERGIVNRLAEAAKKEQESVALTARLTSDAAEMNRAKAGLLAAARVEADRQRGEILARAREDVAALETKWHGELERQETAFLDDVRERAAAEILAVSRAAVRDLASADLQSSAVHALMAKLSSLDPSVLRSFGLESATVVTREDLRPELRDVVRDAIEGVTGCPSQIAFERVPDMAWGLELRGKGQRISWTPDVYLNSLDNKLRIALAEAKTAAYSVTTL